MKLVVSFDDIFRKHRHTFKCKKCVGPQAFVGGNRFAWKHHIKTYHKDEEWTWINPKKPCDLFNIAYGKFWCKCGCGQYVGKTNLLAHIRQKHPEVKVASWEFKPFSKSPLISETKRECNGVYKQQIHPVVYPDEYRLIDPFTNKKFKGPPIVISNLKEREEAYKHFAETSTTLREGRNRKYLRGTSFNNYKDVGPPECLDVVTGGEIKIDIQLEDNSWTYVRVVNVSERKELLAHVLSTCKSVFSDKDFIDGHVRKGEHIGDLGRMATLGYNWNTHDAYRTCRGSAHANETRECLAKLTPLYKEFMEEIFPDELEQIREAEKMQGKHLHGMKEMIGLCSSLQTTEDQGGASHCDLDASMSVAVWAVEEGTNPANWSFMFPFTTRDGRVVVVPLFHGCAIAWDGRVLQHCTSKTHNVGYKQKHVYALMAGSSSAPIGGEKKRKSRDKVNTRSTTANN